MTDETTNPNRWTAEVHMAAGTNGREYAAWLYDGGRYIGKPVHGMEKDCNAFAKQINRPAPIAPADDLPPGVERISDGTYICRGIDIPEGWGFYGPAESISASEDESRPWWDWRDRETDVRTGNVYYQVRPVTPAEPATEWVPWEEAFNAELPLVEWSGQVIKNAQRQHSGVLLSTWGLFPVIRPDAGGRVEVQR